MVVFSSLVLGVLNGGTVRRILELEKISFPKYGRWRGVVRSFGAERVDLNPLGFDGAFNRVGEPCWAIHRIRIFHYNAQRHKGPGRIERRIFASAAAEVGYSCAWHLMGLHPILLA